MSMFSNLYIYIYTNFANARKLLYLKQDDCNYRNSFGIAVCILIPNNSLLLYNS